MKIVVRYYPPLTVDLCLSTNIIVFLFTCFIEENDNDAAAGVSVPGHATDQPKNQVVTPTEVDCRIGHLSKLI